MTEIVSIDRTVRRLFTTSKAFVPYEQFSRAWESTRVRQFVLDLHAQFEKNFNLAHKRADVAAYRPYFLGVIVSAAGNDSRILFEGYQHLTTLTLLFIYLDHLRGNNPDIESLQSLIYSQKFGTKSFHIHSEDHAQAIEYLLRDPEFRAHNGPSGVQTILNQYQEIKAAFPNGLKGEVLPFFVDWLLERVVFTEIVVPDAELGLQVSKALTRYTSPHRGQGTGQQLARTEAASTASDISVVAPRFLEAAPAEEPDAAAPTRKTPVSYQVNLMDLINAHLLFPGEGLFASVSGNDYHAVITQRGTVVADGKEYASLSGAAAAMMGRPINGWTHWKVNRGGQLIQLFDLRNIYLQKFGE